MENTNVTFLPEEDGPAIPTFTVASGQELRRLYIIRSYDTQVYTWIDQDIVPSCVPAEEVQVLLNQWMAEATVLYPEEGDYRVRVLDLMGNPIQIGSDVEYIVEEDQVSISPCGEGTPVCTDRVVVIQICNENSVTDDNFDIYLNNVLIGNVDLSSNTQAGSVFIATWNTSLDIASSDFACPLNLMSTFRFDPAIVKANNTLEMRNTQDNGTGNQGTVGIRNYLVTNGNLNSPCMIADLTYFGGSGIDFNFTFSYTDCCQ